MSIVIERFWPYVIAVAAWLFWLFALNAPFPIQADPLMGASGTVSAVLIGFMGTSKAIVLGLADSAVFKQLKAAGYMSRLFLYLYESLLVALVLLILSILGFFLPHATPPTPPPAWFAAIWVLVGTTATLLYIRTVDLLFRLVRHA
jgi:hypothetical protein